MDLSAFADAVIAAVKGYVGDAMASVSKRMDGFDMRFSTLPAGPRGEAGARGPAGEKGIEGGVGPAGPAGPAGPQGACGEVGAPADPELVRAEVAKAVALIPVPKDGRDGADAETGFVLAMAAAIIEGAEHE